jgi:hypothetical protein
MTRFVLSAVLFLNAAGFVALGSMASAEPFLGAAAAS